MWGDRAPVGKTQSKLEAVYDEIEAQGLATPAILPMDLGKATFAQMNELATLIQKEFWASRWRTAQRGHFGGIDTT